MENQEQGYWSYWFQILFVIMLFFGSAYFLYALIHEPLNSVLGGIFYVIFGIGSTLVIWLIGKPIPAEQVNYRWMLIIIPIYFIILFVGALIAGLDQWIPQLRSPLPITFGSEVVLVVPSWVMDAGYAFILVGVTEEVTKVSVIVAFESMPKSIKRMTSSNISGIQINWLAVILGTGVWAGLHMALSPYLSYFLALIFVGFIGMIIYYLAYSVRADALFVCAIIHGLWDAIIVIYLANL